MKVTKATQRWIRNPTDERAAAEGYYMDEASGRFVVDWLADHCSLYEGEWAGEPFVCLPWQRELVMRLFGWRKHSDQWGRAVRRFRKAIVWVPKKNGKSPTLAALALYLLCGDGEQGQKVFFAARDGQQAREITARHALEMVRSSPRLSKACRINIAKTQITHEASRSVLMTLSSSNEELFKAKEGLNGSVLVDETHVVDRRFMQRISRAGISRAEPLHLEFSTSGNDPDSYGKSRFDYGTAVARGDFKHGDPYDPHTLFLYYGAPQDLSDAVLDREPVRFGKLANPAWGRMIGKEEFLSDYAESKQSLQALADFKMYRLNIWQRAQNPWLRAMDWDRCRQPFAASELEGRTCGAGLDLSISGDMTALSLCFPEPVDEAEPSQDAPVKLVTWYWLPEGALKQYGHLVPLAEWARDGWLTVLPDKKIDQRLVRAKIAEILNRYDVGAFAFDPWMAAQFVKELSEEDGFPIEFCYEFRQGIKTFAAPTAAFERLVVTGKLQHDGNPITAWQAGHVEVLTDPSGNIRPVKPEKQDHRKVDGIVSAVMALDATTRMEGSSAYDSRGQFTVGDILGMSSEPEQEEAMTT